jgi:hypothetical protein
VHPASQRQGRIQFSKASESKVDTLQGVHKVTADS